MIDRLVNWVRSKFYGPSPRSCSSCPDYATDTGPYGEPLCGSCVKALAKNIVRLADASHLSPTIRKRRR